MLVKTFLETAGNFDERELLIRFHKGIEKNIDVDSDVIHQHGAFLDIYPEYTHCEVAVMMGSWKGRDRTWHIARNSIVKNAKCFIVVETPLLGRVMFQKNKQFRVGVNGFLNNSGTFNIVNQSSDRLDSLGISWNGWKNNPDGHIVLMMQLPGDASLRQISIYEWVYFVVNKIRSITDRKIVIRTHPGHHVKDTDEFYKFISEMFMNYKNIDVHVGREKTFEESIEDAYCTMTYSSGSGIDSILHGIPTVACDPGNFAWEVSSNLVSEIENLKLESDHVIKQWLNNLAYHQWSIDEMESGLVWQHLLPIISRIILDERTQEKKKK